MKKILIMTVAIMAMTVMAEEPVTAGKKETEPVRHQKADAGAEMAGAVSNYFGNVFARMKEAADRKPDVDSFREVMKPVVEGIKGVYGATLLDKDWEIREVYFKAHFLARGFSLKKVKELDYFREKMSQKVEPQLSEPGRGSLVQPRLIAMRYPIIRDGKMDGMVSLMIRTEEFLSAVGLDKMKAYKITCLGKDAESEGELSDHAKEVGLDLPSTRWIIKFEEKEAAE